MWTSYHLVSQHRLLAVPEHHHSKERICTTTSNLFLRGGDDNSILFVFFLVLVLYLFATKGLVESFLVLKHRRGLPDITDPM